MSQANIAIRSEEQNPRIESKIHAEQQFGVLCTIILNMRLPRRSPCGVASYSSISRKHKCSEGLAYKLDYILDNNIKKERDRTGCQKTQLLWSCLDV